MEVGAVAGMRYVKDGIKAARLVMQYSSHTMLVGDKASVFAISMGLPGPTNLSSAESIEKWTEWRQNNCQPNFRKNVIPTDNCGPYRPKGSTYQDETECSVGPNESGSFHIGPHNHDTISMAVVDKVSLSFTVVIFILHEYSILNKKCFCLFRKDKLQLAPLPMGQHSRFLGGNDSIMLFYQFRFT